MSINTTAIFKRTRVLRVKYDGAVSTQQYDMRDRGATLRLGGHISDSILGVIISKMFRGHVLPPAVPGQFKLQECTFGQQQMPTGHIKALVRLSFSNTHFAEIPSIYRTQVFNKNETCHSLRF